MIGIEKISSLLSIYRMLYPSYQGIKLPFKLVRFWKHSLAVAMISESIAKCILRYEDIDVEAVYAAGLLHDIGKLHLSSYRPVSVSRSVNECTNTPYFATEDPDCTHSLAGGMFAELWRLPKEIVYAIEKHHSPDIAPFASLTSCVIHVADVSVHLLGYGIVEEEIPPRLDRDAFARLGIQPEAIRVITVTVLNKIREIESLVELNR
ncbi:metal dependent phosphohydrolase [Chitinispirillum alkaliphilum]|nr:metal dependent phosphohydrolase [Chitinispirillum alkaliphilum]